jgi:hypothetical protein
MAACAALLPAVAAPLQSLDKSLPAPAVLAGYPARLATEAAVVPAGRVPIYSPPSTVNIRLCTFQE